jgi:phospholipase C
MSTDRREFLKYLGTAAAASAFPASIARALAIPANNRTGSIRDVEHVVFLMQENRSFDHYFGALRGVRGFGDPRAVKLPSGKSVWHQPDASHPDGYLLPFRPDQPNLGLIFIEDVIHDWNDTHNAWNGGNYDGWIPNKGTTAMAYLTRKDIPYHYALADAFTVCDAYHCSLLGATDPNRYHMWTGWVGNDGKNGGPVINNAEAGYDWSSYPEKLEKAGISWKIYQDIGEGLDAAHFWGWTGDAPYIGNYGDNALLYLHQYQNALPGNPLADKAKTGTNIAKSGTLFDIFRQDVLSGQLPKVSWIVAPEAYTEHGNWPPNYGAWYVSQMLDALTANPDVWGKTVLFYMFDENDGFFDHIVPPTPPRSRAEGISTVGTTNELFAGSPTYPVPDFTPGPYGLGVRVPMIVISPWSKGGFVNSEVFDHTSLIRFVEQRFGVVEPNITTWRRTVAGDLISAFDFESPNDAVVSLPSTVSYEPPNTDRYPDYVPTPPANQSLPEQEPGTRPARSLPYELYVEGSLSGGGVDVSFRNSGKAGASFQVRFPDGSPPKTYTVGAGQQTADTILGDAATYDFAVYGPNGFLRTFAGGFAGDRSKLEVTSSYEKSAEGIGLTIRNNGQDVEKVSIFDAYTGKTEKRTVQPGHMATIFSQLHKSFGWYDLTVKAAGDAGFARQLAGHVETGRPSVSDPAIGSAAALAQNA